MDIENTRSAKPFSAASLLRLQRFWQTYRNWRLRNRTRRILSRLNEAQLKDIGLTADDIRRYR